MDDEAPTGSRDLLSGLRAEGSNRPSRPAGSIEAVRDWFRRQGLVRPRRGRVLGGVIAAFARRYDINPWLLRLAVVVSVVLPGPQVLAYILLWIAMPAER